MIWFILAAIAWIITVIYVIAADGFGSGVGCFFGGLFLYGLAALLIFCVIGAIFTPVAKSDFVDQGYYEIYALKDNGGVSGSFFLGSGSVKSTMYYYYLSEDNDGYKIYKLDVNSASINYTNEKPKIEVFQTIDKTKWLWWVGAFWAETKYVIYVPQDSIDMTFSVDLE
jgi:hypothetical protein